MLTEIFNRKSVTEVQCYFNWPLFFMITIEFVSESDTIMSVFAFFLTRQGCENRCSDVTLHFRDGFAVEYFCKHSIGSQSFVCDLQSNILVLSQDKQAKAGKSCDNVCLLDESGDLIDTFCIEEIKNKIMNAMAITDLGFLWIGGEDGIFIFDYQMAAIHFENVISGKHRF
jgi:hypothetical protein